MVLRIARYEGGGRMGRTSCGKHNDVGIACVLLQSRTADFVSADFYLGIGPSQRDCRLRAVEGAGVQAVKQYPRLQLRSASDVDMSRGSLGKYLPVKSDAEVVGH